MKSAVVLLALAASLATFGCGGDSAPAGQATLKVGLVLSGSGSGTHGQNGGGSVRVVGNGFDNEATVSASAPFATFSVPAGVFQISGTVPGATCLPTNARIGVGEEQTKELICNFFG